MKNIVSVLFAAFFISNFAFAQITDPFPYCTSEYHEEPVSSDVRITNVKLNAINNASSGGSYTYFDNLGSTELVKGETYTITIETENAGTAHALAAWIDFDGNGGLGGADLLGDLVTPQVIGDVNTFTFTVPETALTVLSRLRVRIIEDDLYYNTNNQTNVLACNSAYEYTLAGGGTTFEFANGETEDYQINVVETSSEATSVNIYSDSPGNIIFVDGATLQMYADVLPSFLPQGVTWSVLDATGSAYITVDGELVPLANGVVSVIATSVIDGNTVQDAKNVIILNQSSVISLGTADDDEGLCTGQTTDYTIQVGINENITEDFNFSIEGLPAGSFSNITPTSLNESGDVTVNISNFNAVETSQTILFIASFNGATYADTIELSLSTFIGNPITPFSNTPFEGDINVPLLANFDWFDALKAYTYDVQVATDEDFNNIVVDESDIFGSEYTLTDPLNLNSDYFWRVRSVNPCGVSAWSFVFGFKTIPNDNIVGCTDPDALNYNATAQLEDGSCLYTVVGCLDTLAINYNADVDVHDSTTCEYIAYIESTVVNDSTYHFKVIHAVGNITAIEWDFGDNTSSVWGETPNHTFTENGNYTVMATVHTTNTIIAPNGIIILYLPMSFQANGCTDPYAYNFSIHATIDDGTCEMAVLGCTDPFAANYDDDANVDDGSCADVIFGCTDEDAFNYDPAATIDDGSCIATVLGCTDETAFNYDSLANTNDGSCIAVVEGCTDVDAFNYNPNANTDDGSCIDVILGCTDEDALNYNSYANTDNGSCEYPIATTPSWTVSVNSENHTILIPATADITVQGNDIVIGDYIGVFYTDDEGVLSCAGKLEWNGVTTTLTAYGTEDNEDNGFISDEVFTWMVWDATDGLDHEAEVSYDATMPNTNTYSNDGISSILSLSTEVTQTISLDEGWSLISTNLNPSNVLLDSVLSSISEDIFLAKDEDGNVFWPEFGINNIGDHTVGKAYKVKMDASSDLVISGSTVDPSANELSLPEGWSYLGYLRKQPANISSALASIATDIFIVKNGMGDVYWPAFNINGIGNMIPGEGYQIKMDVAADFYYPSNDLVLPLARLSAQAVVSSVNRPAVTANNMTVGIPLDAWSEMPEIGTEVYVFNEDNKVVGASVFQEENLVIAIFGSDEWINSIDEDAVYHLGMLNQSGQVIKLNKVQYAIGNSMYRTDDIHLVERMAVPSGSQKDWTVFASSETELSVEFDYNEAQKVQFELRDLSGRLLFESVEYLVEKDRLTLSVPGLPTGQYILSNIGVTRGNSSQVIQIK